MRTGSRALLFIVTQELRLMGILTQSVLPRCLGVVNGVLQNFTLVIKYFSWKRHIPLLFTLYCAKQVTYPHQFKRTEKHSPSKGL